MVVVVMVVGIAAIGDVELPVPVVEQVWVERAAVVRTMLMKL